MLVSANIFQPLIDVFQHVLIFFHDNVGVSWGFAIVMLTICVRIVLAPLTVKQFHSMRKLQHLQPQMKALQQKYKNDKQRQSEEMMKFYRENEVNPLGSCLPLVAQLPVMISLFYMLRKNLRTDICPHIQHLYQAKYAAIHHIPVIAAAGQTRACGPHAPGASFLFIPDITNTATGAVLIALLALYIGTQLASTLLMATPTMDQNQRRMMLFMPLIFVIFVIRFPAGLIVYWITTNAWTMGQQYTLKRLMGPMPVPSVGDSGDGSGGLGRSRGSAPAGGSGPRDGIGGRGGSGNGDARDGGGGEAAVGRNGAGEASEERGVGSRLRTLAGRAGDAARGGTREEKVEEPVRRAATPPPPPRKKKKRSGRRR